MTNHYKYFSHKECEFFPCHKESDGKDFNCLFCFCPLYLVKACGGAYTYTETGTPRTALIAFFPIKRKTMAESWLGSKKKWKRNEERKARVHG